MSFTVTLRPSGHSFEVDDDERILEAALREGFAFPYGCRNGACRSCIGRLIEGEVDYGPKKPPGLSVHDIESGKVLCCQAVPLSDLELEVRDIGAARGIVVKTLPVRVAALERLNHDVMEMRLRLPSTEQLTFLPGQYIDILLRDGKRRSFSLANPPHRSEYLELHVRHVPGGLFTGQVFESMAAKALLRIEGPLGAFFLREDSERPMLMVAGGTGFAPIQGMIEHAMEMDSNRPIHFFWGARAKEDLYRHERVQAWATDWEPLCYTPVLSSPSPDDAWSGETGWVHEAVLRAYPDMSAYDVYLCGPPAMIEAAEAAFIARGLPEDRLFYDSFEYGADTLDAIQADGGDAV